MDYMISRVIISRDIDVEKDRLEWHMRWQCIEYPAIPRRIPIQYLEMDPASEKTPYIYSGIISCFKFNTDFDTYPMSKTSEYEPGYLYQHVGFPAV